MSASETKNKIMKKNEKGTKKKLVWYDSTPSFAGKITYAHYKWRCHPTNGGVTLLTDTTHGETPPEKPLYNNPYLI